MKFITKTEYETIVPNGNKEYFYGLSNEQQTIYLELNTLYRLALNQYMSNTFLKTYDKKISESGLKFLPVNEGQKDIYQSCSDLNYYYIRNNIYIERIPMDKLNEFRLAFTQDNYKLTERTSSFISNTFPEVIKENVAENQSVSFGPLSTAFFVNNGSLVIGFRYDEFNLNGMSDEIWDENNDKQHELSESTNAELQEELENKLGMTVKIIQYDDHTTIPLTAENNSIKR